ncbi:MAG: deoxynucleoside kinase [Bacteroidales bacterium]|nr:deoxynucleoside kinase [Bacteroidales bacterium]MCL2738435.1 deoxynucleoside kinase [Bacteroidales bacterium]
MHVAVSGNIGSGKTTLTGLLARHYGWEPKYEDADSNPYLNDFYKDMPRWAFNLQIYFLNKRLAGIVEIKKAAHTVIQDRTIYEDACIFAANLHAMGLMTTRDYSNYRALFDLMMTLVPPPDLLIYLRASVPTLVQQIQKRGRDYENSIRIDYLQGLNERYEAWFADYPSGNKIALDVDQLKFEENPEDLSLVINRLDAQINGLF